MYLCYLDESGTPDIPGNTSHYVLAGLSIPVWHWRDCDSELDRIKASYDLREAKIHVGWMLRQYREQFAIHGFEKMDFTHRRQKVAKMRRAELLRLQKSRNPRLLRQTRKNYDRTENYIHLTYQGRARFIGEVANTISGWGFARLFAECIDKIHFDPIRSPLPADEQALEQMVSRFELYLQNISSPTSDFYGLLIHDNNPTAEKRHTELMKRFHRRGTFWTRINHIIETPLYVDSELTSMVQVADLCSYALRRYLENGERTLFDLIFQRADRKDGIAVGVRHFTDQSCTCCICAEHRAGWIE